MEGGMVAGGLSRKAAVAGKGHEEEGGGGGGQKGEGEVKETVPVTCLLPAPRSQQVSLAGSRAYVIDSGGVFRPGWEGEFKP